MGKRFSGSMITVAMARTAVSTGISGSHHTDVSSGAVFSATAPATARALSVFLPFIAKITVACALHDGLCA